MEIDTDWAIVRVQVLRVEGDKNTLNQEMN